ncbi:MAG: LytTR family DNA-binding domain-containing protein [Bacteroidales bacterium]|nr:LytTR family DNA-binding domain-containing protein [Bacteroidales bacterium]
MILTCCIIDDEPLAVSLLESYVNKTPFLELKGKYISAVNALSFLNNQKVDLLFLDIQMPELNGLELSRIIGKDTRIIFTTAFEQYALESYRVNAIDYLLKPISYPDFLQATNKALQWYELLEKANNDIEKSAVKSIFIKTEYKLMQIALKDILYIEGMKDYVKIYTESDPHAILSLMSLKSMEEQLPSSEFIRVHRSFIVHAEKIKVIENNRIIFGKQYIPVSDSYKNQFLEYLNRHALFPKNQ